MNFHPHIHAIVLGGGLDVKNHWKDNGKDFFLPIKIISKTFRGKYMAELRQLWENDKLEFHGSAALEKIYPVFKLCFDFPENTLFFMSMNTIFTYLRICENSYK